MPERFLYLASSRSFRHWRYGAQGMRGKFNYALPIPIISFIFPQFFVCSTAAQFFSFFV
jgi:hypothetical protein